MMELVANCDHLRIKRVGSTDYFLINGTDPVIKDIYPTRADV